MRLTSDVDWEIGEGALEGSMRGGGWGSDSADLFETETETVPGGLALVSAAKSSRNSPPCSDPECSVDTGIEISIVRGETSSPIVTRAGKPVSVCLLRDQVSATASLLIASDGAVSLSEFRPHTRSEGGV